MKALAWVVVAASSAALYAACGDDGGQKPADDPDAAVAVDACVPGELAFTLVQPTDFACHENFSFAATATNGSCEPLEVQSATLTAEVLTGDCVPAGATTIGGPTGPPIATVPAGDTLEFLTFDGNPFCCTAPGCPATFDCDERFTLTVETNLGQQVFTNDSHLSLGNCTEICP